MSSRMVSVSATIAARPEQIFALLVDPTQHPLIDGSGSVKKAVTKKSGRLGLGSRFSIDMHLFFPYRTRNVVVEFEEGRRIAWTHLGGGRWRWELSPLENGTTEVTETFDWSKSLGWPVIEAMGFPSRNKSGMEKSLERLARLLAPDPETS